MPRHADVTGDPRPGGDEPVVTSPTDSRPTDSRTVVMAASGLVTIVLAAVAALLPVPYVVQSPGPVVNVLGEVEDRPLIEIEGAQTYPTSGQLDLTTVAVSGGPAGAVSLPEVLWGWPDRTVAVVPQEVVFPPDTSAEDFDEQNAQQMETSQEQATAAALNALGIEVPTELRIAGFPQDAPAAEVLQEGDVLFAVDGVDVATLPSLRDQLDTVSPGDSVTLTVQRDGALTDLQTAVLPDASAEGRTQLGVLIDPTYQFPFTVRVEIDDIGGPSAGTMFALGIIDRLTPGDLTGGEHVAGTGTIDADGNVGPIGGLPQKLVGASRDGADWFLTPADNCNEAGGAPDGLRVVRIETLTQAQDAVETIASGQGTEDLPDCSG